VTGAATKLRRSERCQGHPHAVYKGCTREAQGMPTLEKGVQPLCIRCAPLVHPLYTARRAVGVARTLLIRRMDSTVAGDLPDTTPGHLLMEWGVFGGSEGRGGGRNGSRQLLRVRRCEVVMAPCLFLRHLGPGNGANLETYGAKPVPTRLRVVSRLTRCVVHSGSRQGQPALKESGHAGVSVM
jgi:hypothetical protein